MVKSIKATRQKARSILEQTARETSHLAIYETPFSVKQIVMTDDLRWKITLKLEERIPQTYQNYTMTMTFNPDRYEKEIKRCEAKIDEIESERQTQLIDVRKKRIAELLKDIKEQEKERDIAHASCPDIEFLSTIDSFKYTSDNCTQVVFHIPDTIVEAINTHRQQLKQYKVRLRPLIINENN